MKFARFWRDGLGSYIIPLNSLMDTLEGEFCGIEEWGETGDKFIIELIEMPEEEYDNMPEFEGW